MNRWQKLLAQDLRLFYVRNPCHDLVDAYLSQNGEGCHIPQELPKAVLLGPAIAVRTLRELLS